MFHVLELTIGIYFVIFWNFHTRKEKLFVTVVFIVFLFFNFKGNCLLLGHNLKRKQRGGRDYPFIHVSLGSLAFPTTPFWFHPLKKKKKVPSSEFYLEITETIWLKSNAQKSMIFFFFSLIFAFTQNSDRKLKSQKFSSRCYPHEKNILIYSRGRRNILVRS